MLKRLLVAAVVTWFAASPAFAAEPAADDGFAAFHKQFVAAVVANQLDAVVKLSALPLRSYELGAILTKAKASKDPVSPDIEEADLRKYWKRLLPAGPRKLLAKTKPLRRESDELGPWYAVAHSAGKTWSAWFTFHKTEAGWRWTGTDNVSQ